MKVPFEGICDPVEMWTVLTTRIVGANTAVGRMSSFLKFNALRSVVRPHIATYLSQLLEAKQKQTIPSTPAVIVAILQSRAKIKPDAASQACATRKTTARRIEMVYCQSRTGRRSSIGWVLSLRRERTFKEGLWRKAEGQVICRGGNGESSYSDGAFTYSHQSPQHH